MSLSLGHPLNLVLYIPFRIFAYSSNILKTNFDLMDSMPTSGTLKQVRFSCRSYSFRDLAPVMKVLSLLILSCLTTCVTLVRVFKDIMFG